MQNPIQNFVKDNADMFENIVNSSDRKVYNDNRKYTILNYNKILTMIKDYLGGYIQNRGKFSTSTVIGKTHKLYDLIFTDDQYRVDFTLPEMPQINKDYLVLINEIRILLDSIESSLDGKRDLEMETMIKLTTNQCMKISKVYRDDMAIWLWLSFVCDCSECAKKAYYNLSSPVIHSKANKGGF